MFLIPDTIFHNAIAKLFRSHEYKHIDLKIRNLQYGLVKNKQRLLILSLVTDRNVLRDSQIISS
jgi:hypothetical protein